MEENSTTCFTNTGTSRSTRHFPKSWRQQSSAASSLKTEREKKKLEEEEASDAVWPLGKWLCRRQEIDTEGGLHGAVQER